MSALIAAFGAGAVVKAITYGATAILALGGMFFIGHTIKSSGVDQQRAIDAQKEIDDADAASKVRSNVDALGNDALDKRLRPFERK